MLKVRFWRLDPAAGLNGYGSCSGEWVAVAEEPLVGALVIGRVVTERGEGEKEDLAEMKRFLP